MAEAVYVGRSRPVYKILLYGILTFGVYGRVFLFRTVKEIDGHDVRFLGQDMYRIGVILPILGPLVVKWRLARLVEETVHHDVTARPVHTAGLRWAALIPWIPVFHVLVQRHLTPHWALHRRLADLEVRKEVLEEKRRTARSKAAQEEVQLLQTEITEQEKTLEDARAAAMAIREAEQERSLLRKRAGRRSDQGSWLSPKALVGRLRRRPPDETEASVSGTAPPAPEATAPEERGRLARILRRKPKPPAETEAAPTEAPPPKEAAPETTTPSQEEPVVKKRLFGLLGKKRGAEPEGEAATAPSEPEPPVEATTPTTPEAARSSKKRPTRSKPRG